MFSSGPAQHALGRLHGRRSAAGSSASRGLLQGAACPPSLAELIFCLHSVACLSSLGPTLLFSMFSAFPDVDSKVCVCVCVCVCACVWGIMMKMMKAAISIVEDHLHLDIFTRFGKMFSLC